MLLHFDYCEDAVTIKSCNVQTQVLILLRKHRSGSARLCSHSILNILNILIFLHSSPKVVIMVYIPPTLYSGFTLSIVVLILNTLKMNDVEPSSFLNFSQIFTITYFYFTLLFQAQHQLGKDINTQQVEKKTQLLFLWSVDEGYKNDPIPDVSVTHIDHVFIHPLHVICGETSQVLCSF